MQVERVGDSIGCHNNALLETDAFRDVQGFPELNPRHFKLLVGFKERCVGVQERDETRCTVEIVNVRFRFSYTCIDVHFRLTVAVTVPLERLLVVTVSCRCLAAEHPHDVRALVAHPLVRLCKPINHPDPAHQILPCCIYRLFIASLRRQLRQAPRYELIVAKLLCTEYQIDNLAQRRVRALVIS
ncbi:hypothetical protein AYI69_g6134 [Smittium culicis]|uniref:Uncharacterized protein n=1 Tax=Smittium culicis TaxID=133412 RepID=A0A1R1Y1Q2_9FUNG|nr:hypothetical protein AYI69_g6134 [Smittium culicis]